MSRVWGLLRAARSMSGAEWLEIADAQRALLIAQVLVWFRPVGRLIEPSIQGSPATAWGATEQLAAERLARALNRAASYGILRPQCLVRALALTRLLQSRGIAGSRIRIGVRWEPRTGAREAFAAHAWVEYRGELVGTSYDSVSKFVPFDRLAEAT